MGVKLVRILYSLLLVYGSFLSFGNLLWDLYEPTPSLSSPLAVTERWCLGQLAFLEDELKSTWQNHLKVSSQNFLFPSKSWSQRFQKAQQLCSLDMFTTSNFYGGYQTLSRLLEGYQMSQRQQTSLEQLHKEKLEPLWQKIR